MKKPELIVLGLDGACPGYIKQAVAKQKVSNLKWNHPISKAGDIRALCLICDPHSSKTKLLTAP